MKNKILTLVAALACLGLASCQPKEPEVDPKPIGDDDPPVAEHVNAFTADFYKEEIGAGKFCFTTVGYEGMATAVTWVKSFGYTTSTGKTCIDATEKKFSSHKLLELDSIPEGYVVFCGVAWTGKGVDGVTTIDKEKERAEELAGLAADGKIKLVILALNGAANRGTNSDQLLDILLPECECALVTEAADSDGFFTDFKAANVDKQIDIASKSADLKADLKSLGF